MEMKRRRGRRNQRQKRAETQEGACRHAGSLARPAAPKKAAPELRRQAA